jgi:hypothetical protein
MANLFQADMMRDAIVANDFIRDAIATDDLWGDDSLSACGWKMVG